MCLSVIEECRGGGLCPLGLLRHKKIIIKRILNTCVIGLRVELWFGSNSMGAEKMM